MDIDSALSELGMLSAITDSQQDYRKELAEKNCQTSSCFQILSANPKFVVNIGAVQQNVKHHLKDPGHKSPATVSQDLVAQTAGEPSNSITQRANERRTCKASSRMHHRYFFRPYFKGRAPKCSAVVRDIHTRSCEGGGFKVKLPPPTESTLSHAMASMQIERDNVSASSSTGAVRKLPTDLKVRKGLRAHAR